MSYKSYNADDDTVPDSEYLTDVDKKVKQLEEDISNFENGANTITPDNHTLMKSTYNNIIRQIEQDLNKSIIKFEGKTKVAVINFQKEVRALKRRFESMLDAKKKSNDGDLATSTKEPLEREGDTEEKEEGSGLLKGGKKFASDKEYYNKEQEQANTKDVAIMREIIKDMNDISKRRFNSAPVQSFDIENGEINMDEDLEEVDVEKNPFIINRRCRMMILFIVAVTFTFLLSLEPQRREPLPS